MVVGEGCVSLGEVAVRCDGSVVGKKRGASSVGWVAFFGKSAPRFFRILRVFGLRSASDGSECRTLEGQNRCKTRESAEDEGASDFDDWIAPRMGGDTGGDNDSRAQFGRRFGKFSPVLRIVWAGSSCCSVSGASPSLPDLSHVRFCRACPSFYRGSPPADATAPGAPKAPPGAVAALWRGAHGPHKPLQWRMDVSGSNTAPGKLLPRHTPLRSPG